MSILSLVSGAGVVTRNYYKCHELFITSVPNSRTVSERLSRNVIDGQFWCLVFGSIKQRDS